MPAEGNFVALSPLVFGVPALQLSLDGWVNSFPEGL